MTRWFGAFQKKVAGFPRSSLGKSLEKPAQSGSTTATGSMLASPRQASIDSRS